MNFHLSRQRGATLLVAMIFLAILMLVVASSVRTTNINTRIVGNLQTQKEAESATQLGIERMISGGAFTTVLSPQTNKVDINNSGLDGATYTVTVTPTCIATQKVESQQLDPLVNAEDAECTISSSIKDSGIVNTGDGTDSRCRDAMWDLEAVTTAPNTAQPVTTIHQGVSQRNPSVSC